jgi:tetratricopeptide (TPR) repeat protein
MASPNREIAPALGRIALAVDSLEANPPDEDAAREHVLAATASAPDSTAIRVLAARIRYLLFEPIGALEEIQAAEKDGPSKNTAQWRAEISRRLGWMSDAVRAFDEVARLDPGATDPHEHVAGILSLGGPKEMAEALRRLEIAERLAPGSVDRLLRKARLLLRASREAEAGVAAEAALRLLPDNAELRVETAGILAEAGAFDRAEENLRTTDSDAARLAHAQLRLWAGDAARARSIASQVLARGPSAAAFRIRGAAHVLDGRFSEALPDLDRALSLAPRDTEAIVWKGEAFLRAGQLDPAIAELRRACSTSGAYQVAELLLQWARIRAGASARFGERTFETFQSLLDEVCPDAAGDLHSDDDGRVLAALETAVRRLRGNRSMAPSFAPDGGAAIQPVRLSLPPRHASIVAQTQLDISGPAGALGALDAVFANHPGSVSPWCYRGELLVWLGRYAEARADFETALRMHERTRWAWIGLAAVELLEGNPRRSLEVNARGLATMNNEAGPTLFVYRGEAYRVLGEHDRALADLEKSVRETPNRVGAWINLALTRKAVGDDDSIAPIWLRLRRIAPALTDEAARESGVPTTDRLDVATIVRVLETALRMMRGNRSSTYLTWFNSAGVLRTCLHAVPFDDAFRREELRALRQTVERLAAAPSSAARRYWHAGETP